MHGDKKSQHDDLNRDIKCLVSPHKWQNHTIKMRCGGLDWLLYRVLPAFWYYVLLLYISHFHFVVRGMGCGVITTCIIEFRCIGNDFTTFMLITNLQIKVKIMVTVLIWISNRILLEWYRLLAWTVRRRLIGFVTHDCSWQRWNQFWTLQHGKYISFR